MNRTMNVAENWVISPLLLPVNTEKLKIDALRDLSTFQDRRLCKYSKAVALNLSALLKGISIAKWQQIWLANWDLTLRTWGILVSHGTTARLP
jgi:hypothetical protein